MSKSFWLKAADRVYQYDIITYLSKGGMGEVYLAMDNESGEEVANKFLSRNFINDRDMVMRFDAEARLLKSLSHKNIVKILDYGQYKGVPYIVMEYVDGIPLKELIFEKASDLSSSMTIMEQVLDAVGYLHSRKIIHRDIKPSNILCLADKTVKILDFGISKNLAEEDGLELTRTGDVVGSARYLTPEHTQVGSSSPQADIRNLGMTFYELVTWEYPFKYKNKYDLLQKIKSQNIEFPEGDTTPEALKGIILRMTDIDLNKRYQSIIKVQLDLEKVKEDPQNAKLFSDDVEVEVNFVEEGLKTNTTRIIARNNSDLQKVTSVNGEFKRNRRIWGAASVFFATCLLVLGFINLIGGSDEGKRTDAIAKSKKEKNIEAPLDKKDKNKKQTSVAKKDEKESEPEIEKVKTKKPAIVKRKVASVQKREPKRKSKPRVRKTPKPTFKRPTLARSNQRFKIVRYNRDSVKLSWGFQRHVEYYEVIISRNKSMQPAVFTRSNIKGTSYNWKPESPGKFYWMVRLHNRKHTSPLNSRVGVLDVKSHSPVLSANPMSSRSPASGKTYSLKWNRPSKNSKYRLQVSKNKNFKRLLQNNLVVGDSFNLNLKKEGVYYARIHEVDIDNTRRVSSYSNWVRLRVAGRIPVKAPLLVDPLNEKEFKLSKNRILNFKWLGQNGDQRYEIQVSKKRNFRSNVMEKKLIVNYMQMPNKLSPGKYYWRVRAFNSGKQSPWSKTYYFIVDR